MTHNRSAVTAIIRVHDHYSTGFDNPAVIELGKMIVRNAGVDASIAAVTIAAMSTDLFKYVDAMLPREGRAPVVSIADVISMYAHALDVADARLAGDTAGRRTAGELLDRLASTDRVARGSLIAALVAITPAAGTSAVKLPPTKRAPERESTPPPWFPRGVPAKPRPPATYPPAEAPVGLPTWGG